LFDTAALPSQTVLVVEHLEAWIVSTLSYKTCFVLGCSVIFRQNSAVVQDSMSCHTSICLFAHNAICRLLLFASPVSCSPLLWFLLLTCITSLVSFSQLQKQIIDLATTHFVHLPVRPPAEDLAQVPSNLPSFLGDTTASRYAIHIPSRY
jgi:hypothetical protein